MNLEKILVVCLYALLWWLLLWITLRWTLQWCCPTWTQMQLHFWGLPYRCASNLHVSKSLNLLRPIWAHGCISMASFRWLWTQACTMPWQCYFAKIGAVYKSGLHATMPSSFGEHKGFAQGHSLGWSHSRIYLGSVKMTLSEDEVLKISSWDGVWQLHFAACWWSSHSCSFCRKWWRSFCFLKGLQVFGIWSSFALRTSWQISCLWPTWPMPANVILVTFWQTLLASLCAAPILHLCQWCGHLVP